MAFNFNLRRYNEGAYTDASLFTLAVCFYFFPFFIIGRGLHSSTSQPNLSRV